MGTRIAIRPGDEEDLAEMTRIYIEGWNDSVEGLLTPEVIGCRTFEYRLDYLRQRLTQSPPLVGETDGEIVVISCPSLVSPDTGEIEHVYVPRRHRRKGFATEIIGDMLESFSAYGVSSVVLWSFEGNAKAMDFYEATGWQATGRTKKETIDQTDAELPVVEFARPIPV